MSNSPCICARCAAANPTCCRTAPESFNSCFPLSDAEKHRLAPYASTLGVPAAEVEENTPEFLALMRTLFPDKPDVLANGYPLGGVHWRLPLSSDGSCLFLREKGCFLPRSARPWYCQLFPLWIREGYFVRMTPEACLLTHEVKRLGDVFTAIGLTKEQAKDFYKALCRDWGITRNDE